MGKLKIYIGVFVLLIGILLLIESTKPKPIDWTPSFNQLHKRPWGSFVLHKELSNFFPDATLEDIETTPYEKFISKELKQKNTSYLFINDNINLDEQSLQELLKFTYDGNKVFMASHSLPSYLEDTLKIKIAAQYDYNYYLDSLKKPLYFSNQKLLGKYKYDKGFNRFYFKELDADKTLVLGYHKFDDTEYINYVSVSYGSGKFYLHTQPYAFTNFHMLKENHAQYISQVFSYLDNNSIFWDSKSKSADNEINSPLRFILSNDSLRMAWQWGIVGLLLFVIFMAKRRQRIVPIIKALPNTSIDFAKTIGNLYYQEGKPKDIIIKKITFFLENIRKNHLLDTQKLDDTFKKRLHQKTGVPKDEIDKLINYIIFLSRKDDLQEVSLVTLNKMIDAFYKHSLINTRH